MSSFWLINDSDDSEMSSGDMLCGSVQTHFGVFNQSPKNIAQWLSRPATPFCYPSSAPSHSKYGISSCDSSSQPFPSPFSLNRADGNNFQSPRVTVF